MDASTRTEAPVSFLPPAHARSSSGIATDAVAPPAEKAAKQTPKTEKVGRPPKRYRWHEAIPFFLVHLAPLGAIWTGVTWQAVVCCIALYWGRMFFTTGAYHRYFSHRTFKTSRVFQFILAFMAQTSAQKGALWWAAHHRRHHKYSDMPEDLHSVRQDGFWYSHVGWILDSTAETDWDRIPDLAKYPELRFLNRFHLLPAVVLGAVVWALLGWSGLWIGFMLSTVILWHGTFTINSLSHVFGKRRFETTDDSKNNWLLAIVTMGEGWHNNHHHHMHSTRQGFYWWEFDLTYYGLKVLSWLGLVWDLKEPPARILEEGRAADRARRAARATA
jgi:stearoyl-CoA desaturase (Delta-9 desaturase)